MKIFCHIPREDWIVDRMGIEFVNHSKHKVSTELIENDTDIVWLFASWCWNQIPVNILENKKVVCTIHHEVPEKFNVQRKANFLARDKYVDFYHTYTNETHELIRSLTNKPIKIIPHWVNNKIWYNKNKTDCRKSLGLPDNKFIIGSFQRDTEGSDLCTPKMEKGPDILVNKINEISKFKNNVHVLLSGWRRQYVITRLEALNIEYTYIDRPSQKIINDLYNALDLYIVSSRCEGGPQAIFEASCLKTPIISTHVGQSFFLNDNCIYKENDEINAKLIDLSSASTEYNFANISHLFINNHVKKYDEYLEGII